jgi:hypothetical protein
VVSAAKQFAGTASFGGRAGAVPAHVVKAAQNSVAAAHEQQRLAHQFRREVVARTGDLAGVTNDLPSTGEYFFLRDEYGRSCVERGRNVQAREMSGSTKKGLGRFVVREKRASIVRFLSCERDALSKRLQKIEPQSSRRKAAKNAKKNSFRTHAIADPRRNPAATTHSLC